MVKTFFRLEEYKKEETIDVVISREESVFIRIRPSFMVDTQVELRLVASDGTEEVGQVMLPAFSELVMIPDKFIRPGILDFAVVELNEVDVNAKIWSGPSILLYSMDYCFGAHDRINELIEALPKINEFLREYPELKETVNKIATIVFDPLDVGGLGG